MSDKKLSVKWKARLQGNIFDLQTLAAAFTDDPKVTVDADGNHVLEATAFDQCSEAGSVQAEAARLLTVMNGAAKALDSSFRFVVLAGHFENETGLHVVLAAASLEARSRLSATATVVGGDAVELPPPPAQTWAALAASDKNVADALRLLGSVEIDWIAAWKLFEIVKDDAGGELAIIREGWATQPQLSAFRASANRPDVSGDAARHARMSGAAPKRAMSLPEGRQFVIALVQSWLRWKVGRQP